MVKATVAGSPPLFYEGVILVPFDALLNRQHRGAEGLEGISAAADATEEEESCGEGGPCWRCHEGLS